MADLTLSCWEAPGPSPVNLEMTDRLARFDRAEMAAFGRDLLAVLAEMAERVDG